jgi:hypothetical protein
MSCVMQVCCLDLSSNHSCRTPSFAASSTRSRPTPSWQVVHTQGMVPSARTAAATAVLGKMLLLHGGMLCSKAVAGRLAADTYVLDLSRLAWTKMAPAQERAVGSMPRASHRAVAVPSAAALMLIGRRSNVSVCCCLPIKLHACQPQCAGSQVLQAYYDTASTAASLAA